LRQDDDKKDTTSNKGDDDWGAVPATTDGQNDRKRKKDSKKVTNKAAPEPEEEAAPSGPDPERSWIKSYWTDVAKPLPPRARGDFIYRYPEVPLMKLTKEQGEDLSHQVQYGKGAVYYHQGGRPTYIDNFENPYAVFVFNYRSKGMCFCVLAVRYTAD